MSESVAPVVETPVVAEPLPQAVSIEDHAEQFGPEKPQLHEATGLKETPAQAQQRRDRETGQFREGKTRHRAKSQQASPEDVPRIQALTAKQRAGEERIAQLEQEVQRYRSQPSPQPQAQPAAQPESRPAPPPPAQADPWTDPRDPEPNDTDEKYGDNYGQFLKDQAKWAGREAWRQQSFQQWQYQQQQQHLQGWGGRMQAAAQKYHDFQAVALGQVPWQEGSTIDYFVKYDDAGPDILYHLQSQPQERDEILRLTPFAQTKRLSLLSQRFSSSSPAAAESNGAAPSATPSVVLPPKPPTPLRTEAQRSGTPPPPTDGSLSIDEHRKAFDKRRPR